jgi:antitoxin component of MazEF toxin-antitoxin module
MSGWREDRELLPKLGWIIEYLLDEESGCSEVLSEGSGLCESRTGDFLRLLAGDCWFVSETTDQGFRVELDDTLREIQRDYLEGVLYRITRCEKAFRCHNVEARTWIQYYENCPIVSEEKSSGVYYKVRIPQYIVSTAQLDKGDSVEISLVDDLDSESYLTISPAEESSPERRVYKLFDEAPSNQTPTVTVPAEYSTELLDDGFEGFVAEVWQRESCSIQLHRNSSSYVREDRVSELLNDGVWAMKAYSPLYEFFHSNQV